MRRILLQLFIFSTNLMYSEICVNISKFVFHTRATVGSNLYMSVSFSKEMALGPNSVYGLRFYGRRKITRTGESLNCEMWIDILRFNLVRFWFRFDSLVIFNISIFTTCRQLKVRWPQLFCSSVRKFKNCPS